MKQILNFINGEYVRNTSGKTFQDINPVNGSVIGNSYEAGEVEVNAAVAAAKAALKGDWGRLSVAERCKL
ncbi:aldehyde dehydrogenase family protein, partial [Leclercia adecarboxylata]